MLASILICCIPPLIYFSWKIWISRLSSIPCPKSIPWLGNSPFLELDSHKFFLQIFGFMEENNYLFNLWVGPTPVLCSGKKEHARYVLSSNDITRKSSFYGFLQHWLGLGLLLSWGDKWKTRRKAITPSFHFSVLNDFQEVFVEHAKSLVNKLQQVSKEMKIIDIQKFSRLATLDIICETAMGVKVNAQEGSCEYADTIAFVNNQLIVRIRSPWLWPDFIYKLTPNGKKYYQAVSKLHEFTTNVIETRIAARKLNQNTDEPKKAFLDTLLNLYDRGEIDVEGIREEVDTFMFEGHDTTASSLSFILYLLAIYPDIQKKLQLEIDASFNVEGTIADKIASVKYLDCVVKEGLRLHPPVLFMARLVGKDERIGDLLVPKGTEILITPGAVHRNPEYWPEPEKFIPERFNDEESIKRDPFTYIPFSAGPRNCIGKRFALLELKTLVYRVLAEFRLTSPQSYDELELTLDIIHHSRNGLLVQFDERMRTN